MTLKQLIDKATAIGRQVTSCDEIPVLFLGMGDCVHDIELRKDDYGQLYAAIT